MATADKPAYRVPTMNEIGAIRPNGFQAISLFAGGGGSSLGYRMAGFRMRWASEFIDAAREVYEANAAPGTIVDGRDIRLVDPLAVLRDLGLKPGELDLLDGSPPCSDFSSAGKRNEGWGRVKKYCVSPETPILLTDLRWKKARDIVQGDQVVAFDEDTPGTRRKFKPASILDAGRLRRPCVRITTSDGASVICSTDHRWLISQGRNLRWRKSSSLRIGQLLLSIGRPWEEDRTFDGGYLTGILDGEGCISKQKDGGTRLLNFAQRPGVVLDRAVEILRRTGAPFGIYRAAASDTLTVNINGGPFSKARVLGTFRALRLLQKSNLLWDGVDIGSTEKVKITSIEPIGIQDVIAISTTSKTFIADGLLSHNSNKEQRVDDLFFEYVRFIKAIQPKVFVAENVSGLVKGVAKGYFLEILRAMKACGYRVEARLLDAQWLGVPQARERLIFIGVREDLGLAPAFPEPLPYRYSVRDAIPEIGGKITPGGRGNRRRREEKKPHELDEPLTSVMADGARAGDCQFMVDVVVRQGANGAFGGATWQDTRTHPSPTIGAGPSSGNGLSPPSTIEVVRGAEVEKRKITIDELKRICAFPDDFVVSGTYGQQWERLGRAVPPLMMRAIAIEVRDRVLIPAKNKAASRSRKAAR